MKDHTKLTIKDLAEEDRPREKMLLKGVSSLSDAELLAILIGSGNSRETAVELSQRMLSSVNNNLNSFGKLAIQELIRDFRGIGEAKAITIVAALELGKRRKLSDRAVLPQITSSNSAYDIIHPVLGDLPHEEMWALFLNKGNKVMKKIQLSKGGIGGTVLDVKILMKEAIENLASSIILCHNHPSGNIKPSVNDNKLTAKVKAAGELLEISLLDHLIVCDGKFYSYKDQGQL